MLTEKELRNRLKNSEFFYYKKNSKTLSRKKTSSIKTLRLFESGCLER